jgi:hypothetical protein
MSACPKYVSPIRSSEKIGNSLIKINNNFTNLKNILCELYDRVTAIAIRTFFYYGPNSENNISSNLDSGRASYPSTTIIESFVNDVDQLNVPSYSRLNDQVYVIYQKTGYYDQYIGRVTSGSTVVPAPAGYSPASQTIPWSFTTNDYYTNYTPIFVIYKLVYNGQAYKVASGFPKFTQATTVSTNLWNQPQNWGTY